VAAPPGLPPRSTAHPKGLRTIVVEREAPGGQAGTSSRIENYLGFPSGVSGDELASRALQQARRLGAEILVTRSVARIDPAAHEVALDGGERVHARTLIIATASRGAVSPSTASIADRQGSVLRRLAPARSARRTAWTSTSVGAGNSAGQAALYLPTTRATVSLVVRGDSLEKSMSHYLIEQLHKKSERRGPAARENPRGCTVTPT